MSTRPVRLPHYLPAALIGGFGVQNRTGADRLRDREIAVRWRFKPDRVLVDRAGSVAIERDLYKIQAPQNGETSGMVDVLWDAYEPQLPTAIRAMEKSSYAPKHWAIILEHVRAQGVRHPDFRDMAQEFFAARGGFGSDVDRVQRERIRTYGESPAIIARCRFALVRTVAGSARFVINDKGFTCLEDRDRGIQGAFFPISPNLGIMLVADVVPPRVDPRHGPTRQLMMKPDAVGVINQAAWCQNGIRCVIGHPGARSTIAQLQDRTQLELPTFGAYRGRDGIGFFDWAV